MVLSRPGSCASTARATRRGWPRCSGRGSRSRRSKAMQASTRIASARSAGALRSRLAKRRCSCSSWSTITFATRSNRRHRCASRTTRWRRRRSAIARRATQRVWRRSCDASRRALPGGIVNSRRTSRPRCCRSPSRAPLVRLAKRRSLVARIALMPREMQPRSCRWQPPPVASPRRRPSANRTVGAHQARPASRSH